jgi:hypothetical protein
MVGMEGRLVGEFFRQWHAAYPVQDVTSIRFRVLPGSFPSPDAKRDAGLQMADSRGRKPEQGPSFGRSGIWHPESAICHQEGNSPGVLPTSLRIL